MFIQSKHQHLSCSLYLYFTALQSSHSIFKNNKENQIIRYKTQHCFLNSKYCPESELPLWVPVVTNGFLFLSALCSGVVFYTVLYFVVSHQCLVLFLVSTAHHFREVHQGSSHVVTFGLFVGILVLDLMVFRMIKNCSSARIKYIMLLDLILSQF